MIQQASAKPASILGVSREILVTEGARGFFKGMLYPVITAGAINSVFFGVYGVCMDKMKVIVAYLLQMALYDNLKHIIYWNFRL